jgi:hypothetical protein
MTEKHLAGNLRVPGLVGTYQPESVSAENRHQAIEQEKRGKHEKADRFQGVVQGRETSFQRAQTRARSSKDSRRTQHCVFLSHRFARYLRAQGYQIQRLAERMAHRPMKQHEKVGFTQRH